MRVTRASAASDPGRKRLRNEDAFVCQPPLFAVADGMGGAQAGEIASRLAAGAVKGDEAAGSGERRVQELIQEANRRVHQRSIEDPNASGMGTTLTLAVVDDGLVSIGHVGDSRAYLVREGRLEQLTEDHSLVGELMRSGELSAEEAESHPQRSVITRALGTDPDVDVDTFELALREGDLFLLCSDGLTSMVDDEEILELVERHRLDLDRLVQALIRTANRGGGEDNITVVAFAVENEEEKAVDDTLVAAGAAVSEPDDEDTLTEADRVPTVDGAVVEAEEDEQAGPSLLGRLLRFLLVAAVVAAVIAIALWGLSQ
jgi:serine/threonine protein phosphatase PrpC